ncbi:hypothetical protein BASA62_004615 [Batrachochytrium salamandrivorans]|nr:hypothetical protein BASA62_004615 [Batrachochytrium salamandrivorans]
MATGDKQARAKLFADLRAARDFVLFQPEASSKRVRLSGPVEAPVMPPRLADHMKHIVPQRRFQEGSVHYDIQCSPQDYLPCVHDAVGGGSWRARPQRVSAAQLHRPQVYQAGHQECMALQRMCVFSRIRQGNIHASKQLESLRLLAPSKPDQPSSCCSTATATQGVLEHEFFCQDFYCVIDEAQALGKVCPTSLTNTPGERLFNGRRSVLSPILHGVKGSFGAACPSLPEPGLTLLEEWKSVVLDDVRAARLYLSVHSEASAVNKPIGSFLDEYLHRMTRKMTLRPSPGHCLVTSSRAAESVRNFYFPWAPPSTPRESLASVGQLAIGFPSSCCIRSVRHIVEVESPGVSWKPRAWLSKLRKDFGCVIVPIRPPCLPTSDCSSAGTASNLLLPTDRYFTEIFTLQAVGVKTTSVCRRAKLPGRINGRIDLRQQKSAVYLSGSTERNSVRSEGLPHTSLAQTLKTPAIPKRFAAVVDDPTNDRLMVVTRRQWCGELESNRSPAHSRLEIYNRTFCRGYLGC